MVEQIHRLRERFTITLTLPPETSPRRSWSTATRPGQTSCPALLVGRSRRPRQTRWRLWPAAHSDGGTSPECVLADQHVRPRLLPFAAQRWPALGLVLVNVIHAHRRSEPRVQFVGLPGPDVKRVLARRQEARTLPATRRRFSSSNSAMPRP